MRTQKKWNTWLLKWIAAMMIIVIALPSMSVMGQEVHVVTTAKLDTQAQVVAQPATTSEQASPVEVKAEVTSAPDTIVTGGSSEQGSSATATLSSETSESTSHSEPTRSKRGKRAVETAADVVSLAHSAYEYKKDPSVTHAAILVWDAAAVAIPGLPGSYVGKAFKAAVDHAPDAAKAGKTTNQGLETRGYQSQQGERTFNGYVNQNVSSQTETKLFTQSPGFHNNTNKNEVGGQFKRYGTRDHANLNPHVHQPMRNVPTNQHNSGQVYGFLGRKTNDGGLTSPGRHDISQLYDHLNNGKYKP